MVGHMSLITSAFHKANLNNNNNVEANKYMLPYMFTLRKWANPLVEAYTCYLMSAVDS